MSGFDDSVDGCSLLDRLTPTLAKPAATNAFMKSLVAFAVAATAVAFLGSISLATGGQASGISVLVARPLAAVQTAVGLSLCSALLLTPALRGIVRLWARQEVRVGRETVEILRHTPVGIARRSVPLNDYRGLAHNIRASLSGLTHEIVLVHPDTAFSVTLLSADRVTQAMLEQYKSLFGLPELPARAIYDGRGETPSSSVPTPLSPVSA